MLDADWGVTRPDRDAIERVWSSASFERVAVEAPAVTSYVDAVAETRPGGDARWCCIEVPKSRTLEWFAARNCLAEADFFQHLLASAPVLAELGLDPEADPDGPTPAPAPEFTVESPLTLDGLLAELLVHGGSRSYGDVVDQSYGTAARAKRLARDAHDEVVQDRYEEVTVHRTREPWCGWFGDPAWNLTLVAVDRRYRLAWVLVATDEGPLAQADDAALAED